MSVKHENNFDSPTARANATQKRVSDAKVSAWVSASAGSGKTKVLVDRVLNLLLYGADVRKIWCITYTNAGASEMVGRINKELKKFAVMPKEKLIDALEKLGIERDTKNFSIICDKARSLFAEVVDSDGGIKITTIHGLCQGILKRFPIEADLSPHFNVLDEDKANEIISEVVVEVLAEEYKNADQSFMKLINDKSEKGFRDILDNALTKKIKLYEEYTKSGFDFDVFISPYYKITGINRGECFIDTLKNTDVLGALEKLKNGIIASGKPIDKIENDVFEAIDRYKGASTDKVLEAAFDGLFRSKLFTADIKLRKNLEKKFPFAKETADLLVQLHNHRDAIMYMEKNEAFLRLTLKVIEKYRVEKLKRMALDFDDLILKTAQLLQNRGISEWVLYRLDNGVDHLLVDEAQDTSPEQWQIIKSICEEFFAGDGVDNRNRTLFVVGDKKQSIYSFQGARPEMFEMMCEFFKNKMNDAKKQFIAESMPVSFRSSGGVLDLINACLNDDRVCVGVVSGDEKAEDIKHQVSDKNSGKGAVVELWNLPEKNDSKKNEDIFTPDRIISAKGENAKNTALKVAKQIRALIDGKSDGTERRFEPSDIMVLLRSRSNQVLIESIVKYCKELNVPIIGVDKFKLNDNIVIADMLSLGKFLLTPNDDLSLAEVLKSPLFDKDDDWLYDFCVGRENKHLYDVIREKYTVINADGEKEKTDIYGVLDSWLEKSTVLSLYDMYSLVLDGKYGGRRRYIARMGEFVDDILKEFLARVLDYEKENIPTLFAFTDWLGKTDINVKRENSEDAVKAQNAVRIMTVHASKGLQSEVVIIPDACSQPDIKQEHVLSDDKMFFMQVGKDIHVPKAVNDVKDAVTLKILEEYHRLLYVALSRAKSMIYIAGVKDSEKLNDVLDGKSWYADLCRIMPGMMPTSAIKTENTVTDEEVLRLYKCDKKNQEEDIVKDNLAKEKETEVRIKKDNTLFLKEDIVADVVKDLTVIPDPFFLDCDLPSVKTGMPARPLRPSKSEDEDMTPSPYDEVFFKRGILIHKLLEIMPENDESMAFAYLAKEGSVFSKDEQKKMIADVKNIMVKFPAIFSANSWAEIPVMGMADKTGANGKTEAKEVLGQIDRLAVTDDEVIIVDYKTNRFNDGKIPEKILNKYRRQLEIYATLMQRVYPTKKVKAYILWTENLKMDQII